MATPSEDSHDENPRLSPMPLEEEDCDESLLIPVKSPNSMLGNLSCFCDPFAAQQMSHDSDRGSKQRGISVESPTASLDPEEEEDHCTLSSASTVGAKTGVVPRSIGGLLEEEEAEGAGLAPSNTEAEDPVGKNTAEETTKKMQDLDTSTKEWEIVRHKKSNPVRARRRKSISFSTAAAKTSSSLPSTLKNLLYVLFFSWLVMFGISNGFANIRHQAKSKNLNQTPVVTLEELPELVTPPTRTRWRGHARIKTNQEANVNRRRRRIGHVLKPVLEPVHRLLRHLQEWRRNRTTKIVNALKIFKPSSSKAIQDGKQQSKGIPS